MRRVGVLTHVSGGGGPAGAFARTIRLAQIAEECGYDSFWVAQHRFGDQNAHLPSPLLMLAALARETDRIRLGTASIAAALEHPRRLAEDATVADVLSGGRLELGLGSGSDPVASAAWGIEHADRHRHFWHVVDEALPLLRAGGDAGPGESAVRPEHCTPDLGQRIWITAGSAGTADAAAARGLGLIVGRRSVGAGGVLAEDQRVADIVDGFRAASGRRVALSRPVVATVDDAVVDMVAARERGVRGPGASLTVTAGSAPRILAAFDDDPGVRRADHILVHTRPIDVPLDVEAESLRLLAAERMRRT